MNPTIPYTPISNTRIRQITKVASQLGALIYVVRQVRVDQGRDWQSAINLGGPDTPIDFEVRKSEIGTRYPSVSDDKVEVDIILFNFLDYAKTWHNAVRLGKTAKLKTTNPREVFAVGEHDPSLNTILDRNLMDIVATTASCHSTCYIWWDKNSERKAGLTSVDAFKGHSDWYAFREPDPESVH